MFTGIIEETGTVKEISGGSGYTRLRISAVKILEDTLVGDSINTNDRAKKRLAEEELQEVTLQEEPK